MVAVIRCGDLRRFRMGQVRSTSAWSAAISSGLAGETMLDGVAQIARVYRQMLEARLASPQVEGPLDLHLEGFQRNAEFGGLDQRDVGDATAEHAQLKLRRGRPQIVAGEICPGIADH